MADGTFADLRTHWLGRIGTAAVHFARHRGGVLHVARDPGEVPEPPAPGEAPAHLVSLGTRLRLRSPSGGGTRLVRQENDPAPKFHFLEEGPVRLGMRVAFDLLDEDGRYHGDGRQDIWIYPEGDLHVSWALQTVDPVGHGPVEAVWAEIDGDAGYRRVRVGDAELNESGTSLRRAFGEELASRRILFSGPGRPPLGLYWQRDEGEALTVGYDHGAVPPFYASRWPTGMQQWARGNLGWKRSPSAAVHASLCGEGPQVRLAWLEDGAEPEVTHAATLVLSAAADEADLERRIAAVQKPLTPEVHGGDFRCYTAEDGTYEVGQGDPASVRVTFPSDEHERTVRLRHYRRKTDLRHRGGVVATVDGEVTRAQLMSEGELTDDICVVMEMSHRNDSVDDVIVSAALKADAPTTIGIDKVPGIQATYQSEITGVDLQRRAGNRRDVAIWSSRNKERPELELDLFSGAVHRWTNHGQTEPVLWEMPMAWFLSCGISRHHYCNTNDAFEVLENGPERVRLCFSGTNPNRRARSRTWLTIPGGHPRPRIEVRMRMEVDQQWEGANVEFSDLPLPLAAGGDLAARRRAVHDPGRLVADLHTAPGLQRPQPGRGRSGTAPVLRPVRRRPRQCPGLLREPPAPRGPLPLLRLRQLHRRARQPPPRAGPGAGRHGLRGALRGRAVRRREHQRRRGAGHRRAQPRSRDPGGRGGGAMTMEPIRLTVTARDGQPRSEWPLTRGVPLPEGAVGETGELMLAGPGGDVVPVQLRPLARWPDGSLKWVLADFQGHVDGGEPSVYHLQGGGPGAVSPAQAVEVAETEEAVVLCTGPLRFSLPRVGARPFDRVELGRRRDGVFQAETDLSGEGGGELWARIREGEFLGGTRRRIYGMGGECLASLAPEEWSVEVEEAGPLRTVVTCRGALEQRAPMHHYSGYRPLRFVLRIHAWAGQPFVRLQHTLVFHLNPRETQVSEIGLRLPLRDGGGGILCRSASEPHRAVTLSPGGELLLAQQEDNHFRQLETGGKGRVSEGERTEGWLTAESAAGGLGVAMRHMAEQHPTALQAGGGGIAAMPWHHPEGRLLSLERYSEEVAWHEGEGVYSDGTGAARTTELFAAWFAPGDSESAVGSLRGLLRPPHAAVDPGHLSRCQVTGGFAPAGAFPRSDRMLSGFVEWMERQIRLGRWYGFFDYGDALVAWDEAGGDWRFTGRWGWCNSEWDPRHGVWIEYLRTGAPQWFDLGESMTRHSVDVDTCHWHPFRPYFVGGCYRHSVDHFGDEPCASHTFIDNWVDHYYVTGDLRTLEVLREAGGFLRGFHWTEDPQYSFSLRSIANALRGLLYVYEVTGEEAFLRRAEEVYEVIARGQNDDGSWHKRFQVSTPDRQPVQSPYGMASEGTTLAVELGAPPFSDEELLALRGRDAPILRVMPYEDQKGYQTHYLLIGIELLHRLTGRQDVAGVYVRAVDWFCGGPGATGPEFALEQHYYGIICRHLAYAWRLTGRQAYLEIARAVLERLMQMQDWSDDPRRRGAVSMSPMGLSLVFFGVPCLLEALAEAGMAEPGG